MGNYGKIVREKTSQEGSGNMINKVSAIFADIDGTLVNKGENIMLVTKQALFCLGFPPAARSTTECFRGQRTGDFPSSLT